MYAFLIIAGFLASCVTPVDEIVDIDESTRVIAMQDTLVINDKTRTVRALMDPQTLKTDPTRLDVPIIRIENAARVPFSVSVDLHWDARFGPDKLVNVGLINISTENQPDTFTLDAERAVALTRSWGDPEQLHLSFTLTPESENTPLEDIQVHIGPAIWSTR